MDVPGPDVLAGDRSLMILEDDGAFRRQLGRALARRGFTVSEFDSMAGARGALATELPAFAVIDLRVPDGNGLDLVRELRGRRPDARIVVLTGFGAIAVAVAAVRLGARDVLTKPVDADEVNRALLADEVGRPDPPENPMSADRVRWEHIHRIHALCGGNVSETARRLSMHRRTLQRILGKHCPR